MKTSLTHAILALLCLQVQADPVIRDLASTAAPLEIQGDGANHYLGGESDDLRRTLTTADLNADGIEDLVIASRRASTGGTVSVVFGRSSWPAASSLIGSLADVVITGSDTSNRLARAVGCGDVNGDGISDLVIGEYSLSDPGVSSRGKVLVYFGRASWPASLSIATADVTITGSSANGNFGYSISVADFDGDSLSDIAALAEWQSVGAGDLYGKAYLFEGRSTWPAALADTAARTTIHGIHGSSLQEGQLWSGDCDGDGISDLFLGAPRVLVTGVTMTGSTKPGVVWGFKGRAAASWPSLITLTYGPTTDVPFYTRGDNNYYLIGRRGSCGDVNGDGVDDLVIAGNPRGEGAGYSMFFGGADFWTAPTAISPYYIHDIDDRYFGHPGLTYLLGSTAVIQSITLKDWDGDGLAEIITGLGTHTSSGRSQAGLVAVHYGRSSWPLLAEADDMHFYGAKASDGLGTMVACGDITGDGVGDLIFNAPGFDRTGVSNCGKVYVFSGERSEPEVTVSMVGSTVRVAVASRSGRTCLLESSTDLSLWEPVDTWNTDGDTATFDQPGGTLGFFRVAVNPSP